jgi:hypothetical protein
VSTGSVKSHESVRTQSSAGSTSSKVIEAMLVYTLCSLHILTLPAVVSVPVIFDTEHARFTSALSSRPRARSEGNNFLRVHLF